MARKGGGIWRNLRFGTLSKFEKTDKMWQVTGLDKGQYFGDIWQDLARIDKI